MAARGRGGRGGGRGGRGGGRGRGGGDDDEEMIRTPREFGVIKTPPSTWPAYDNLPMPEDPTPEDLALHSKASVIRDFFKNSPFYLKKEKPAKEVRRFSAEKLQSEFRNPTLMEYLHPLFRIFPNEVLEDDQAKRKREALERLAKRRKMDLNFDLLDKLEQQGPKPKADAPSHDVDEDLLPAEEEEETDYTTNFGENDDEGDEDEGDDEPYM